MEYSRPWRSFPEQLELLKSRGMVVTDETAALDYLPRVGYYRLSAYWYPFRKFLVCAVQHHRKAGHKCCRRASAGHPVRGCDPPLLPEHCNQLEADVGSAPFPFPTNCHSQSRADGCRVDFTRSCSASEVDPLGRVCTSARVSFQSIQTSLSPASTWLRHVSNSAID